ncbi:hypothetical protein XENOCAPTIV_001691 [Xenoophorus captivus]|uniref:Alpha-crystallin A chain n=1 Tax=Xenoophorus captivus TaxID=1517983 RepID=A0ABV0Q8C5_9TELE
MLTMPNCIHTQSVAAKSPEPKQTPQATPKTPQPFAAWPSRSWPVTAWTPSLRTPLCYTSCLIFLEKPVELWMPLRDTGRGVYKELSAVEQGTKHCGNILHSQLLFRPSCSSISAPTPISDLLDSEHCRRAMGSIYPTRLFDQFFGEGIFDYDFFPYTSSTISPYYRHSLFRNLLDSSNSGISEVRSDRDKFTVYLDVKHFSPDELSVKVTDDYLEIQGKHGERQDDHGYISREFHRRYRLPSAIDQLAITCTLSADGLLTLTGPKVSGGSESGRGERSIPVSRDDKTNAASSS